MYVFNSQPKLLNAKLTAIWAVSESGLGGLLHAAKIPFSGIFLGSFAIIIITYIAKSNTNRFNAIIKATLLVIAIKAIVSPHSPPMAYVAVTFQGLLGAIVYGSFGLNRFSSISIGAIALLESAFQKILTLTVIFGMGLWESIQQFFDGIQNKLQADWISELPWMFIILYGFLYFLVGIFAGNFAFVLPKKVLNTAMQMQGMELTTVDKPTPIKKKKRKRLWLIFGLLIFSSLVFIFSGMSNMALAIILRTFAVIIFFLFLFNPVFKYLMQKWINKEKRKNEKALHTIMALMPTIKNNVSLAQQLISKDVGVIKRSKSFVMYWLALSLYYTEDETS